MSVRKPQGVTKLVVLTVLSVIFIPVMLFCTIMAKLGGGYGLQADLPEILFAASMWIFPVALAVVLIRRRKDISGLWWWIALNTIFLSVVTALSIWMTHIG